MKIHKLEHDIMLNPNMDTIRSCTYPGSRSPYRAKFLLNLNSVHVLSGDLIMHKLTLEPIKTTIYNLRR